MALYTLSAPGNTRASSELYRPRSRTFKYAGIIPPEKNMVNRIRLRMSGLNITFLEAIKYPANTVNSMFRGSASPITIRMFR
jgi:hypothetical protein